MRIANEVGSLVFIRMRGTVPMAKHGIDPEGSEIHQFVLAWSIRSVQNHQTITVYLPSIPFDPDNPDNRCGVRDFDVIGVLPVIWCDSIIDVFEVSAGEDFPQIPFWNAVGDSAGATLELNAWLVRNGEIFVFPTTSP